MVAVGLGTLDDSCSETQCGTGGSREPPVPVDGFHYCYYCYYCYCYYCLGPTRWHHVTLMINIAIIISLLRAFRRATGSEGKGRVEEVEAEVMA